MANTRDEKGYGSEWELNFNYGLTVNLVYLATITMFLGNYHLAEDNVDSMAKLFIFTTLALANHISECYFKDLNARSIEDLLEEEEDEAAIVNLRTTREFLLFTPNQLRSNFLSDAFNRFALIYFIAEFTLADSLISSFLAMFALKFLYDRIVHDEPYYGARIGR